MMRSTPVLVILWLSVIGILFFGARLVLERQATPPSSFSSENGQRTLLLQRANDGHFRVKGKINGQEVVFLMDTGATTVTLDTKLASTLGLPVGQKVTSQTANGTVEGFETRIPLLQFGGYTLQSVPAMVVPELGDEMLMGMNVISRFDVSLSRDEMKLTARKP
ncbi:aspartyl protease family protein [Andreprevotia lacus DSM 23236]|jgi:aspartyl protease family protein|uniref:Aspartyl protease family protein n=1 Tax=Andreprevotia lacus DSM 23236 TaxID=1121001 RepID=A0A1W1XIQ1_9NEIS|nr:retropepsin-like aspartic protease [Andreprevotia lacus]SMC23860.1 aspartyl protease family protein [Andreprevotia lacus DSM 23236]